MSSQTATARRPSSRATVALSHEPRPALRLVTDADHGAPTTIMVLPGDPFQSLAGGPRPRPKLHAGHRPKSKRPRPASETDTVRGETMVRENVPPAAAPPAARWFDRVPTGARVAAPAHEFAAAAAPAAPAESPSLVRTTAGAKKSARDAWCAVALMGLFIVGGIVWTKDRLAHADGVIADLGDQLQSARAALVQRMDEVKVLYQKLTDAESAQKSAEARLKKAQATARPPATPAQGR